MIYQSSNKPTLTKPKLSLDHVTVVATNPLPTASLTWPAMLAEKLGFYEKYGLTEQSVPSSGSLEALSALVTGRAEFGDLGVGDAVRARGNGTDIRYVFMTQERDPLAVFALEKSGIKTPKDLEGKTMGISFASAAYSTMELFGKAAGFDYKKVKYVNTSPSQYITYLVSGRIDFTMTFIKDYYNYEAAAAKQGEKLVVFFRHDYVNVYGTGIVTTDSFIKQHPDVVRVLTEGYAYGLQYLIDKPKEATNLITSMTSGSDQETVYNIARTYTDFKLSVPRQSGQPYGLMDDKTWETTINVMVDYLGAKRIAPRDIYTNEYVPTQYIPRAQAVSSVALFYDNLYAILCEKLGKLSLQF